MVFQFTNLVRQLCDVNFHKQGRQIINLDTICEEDKALVWKWNGCRPRTNDICITDLFSQQVKRRSNRPAVHAWDGLLTYSELDEQSTLLAKYLLHTQIAGPGQIVPVCFDKTIWTTITILAIAKAGAVFILLDPHQPRSRLAAIMTQLPSSTILTRPDTAEIAQSITSHVVIIDEHFKEMLPETTALGDNMSPSDNLYIVFTSGSTGTPKGVTISHANLSSAVAHQARTLGFNTGVRTFDSSSYTFDAYVYNTFYTLLTGGCLCVPSETDRINNLQAVLQQMKVEFAQLTPSTSRLLEPNKLPLLRTLILTGEKINRTVLDPWLKTNGRVRVINAYGPSECTIMCAANCTITRVEDAESVGFGLGANLWIADLHDINRLAPVGAVGELLIDGPIVGQGYLGDDQKTIESLVQVTGGYLPGVALAPTSPMFRTRDLARYQPDGSICFIGRADTQIKINGQRVEIGEVEYHLGQLLPDGILPIVEAVQWPSGQKQLLAFIYIDQEKGESTLDIKSRVGDLIVGLDKILSDRLPRFMIPSAFFPLQSVPMTASGKTDRKTLRNIALSSPHQLLDPYSVETVKELSMEESIRPLTSDELILGRFWAQVLFIPNPTSLQPHENFIAKGGDSLAAMRLVALLHDEGYGGISVADILQNPHLSNLAGLLRKRDHHAQSDAANICTDPFSLLLGRAPEPNQINAICTRLSKTCGCNTADVEDVYPCSPVQEEMMVLAARNPKSFVTQTMLDLEPDIDLERFVLAWKNVSLANPIIRTRIVDMKTNHLSGAKHQNFAQVVLKGFLPLSRYSNLNECLQLERDAGMGVNEPLFRIGIVDQSSETSTKVIFTMHHAIYDGWFLNQLGGEVFRAYDNLKTGDMSGGSLIPYRNFIQYLHDSDSSAAGQFWIKYLQDINLIEFPAFPEANYKPYATAIEELHVAGIDWANAYGITANILVQTAWALVLSKHSGASDVVFGTTLLGRQISLPGIERVGGPTITTVPIRMTIDWEEQNALTLVQIMQKQAGKMIPFMHYGTSRIRHLNYDAERACQFSTFLVVQPAAQQLDTAPQRLFNLGGGNDDIQAFNTYAVMLECCLTSDGLAVRASFDETILSKAGVQKLLSDLQMFLSYLSTASHESPSLSEVGILSKMERECITALRKPGQNIHVLDAEAHLKECLPEEVENCVLNIVSLPKMSKQLVAFVSMTNKDTTPSNVLDIISRPLVQLSERLSRHMLPTKFLTLPQLPMTELGEIDRDKLNQIATETPTDQFLDYSNLLDHRRVRDDLPKTDVELILQRLWATTLDIDSSSIGRQTSFLSIGGDSLSAMRLVAGLRAEGYSLQVADVLRTSRLADQATKVSDELSNKNLSLSISVEAFSLLEQSLNKDSLAAACQVYPWEIEDAYPCSPIQEAMLARTAVRANEFVSRGLIPLPASVDFGRLKEAWNRVIAETPVLRTRIVEYAGQGFLQVVTKALAPWSEAKSLEQVKAPSMGIGGPMLSFVLIKSSSNSGTGPAGSAALLMTIHHAIYDRWSASLVMRRVESLYRNEIPATKLIPYSRFIKYLIREVDEERCRGFWLGYLADCAAPQFPTLPSPKYQPVANMTTKREVHGIKWPANFTPSTALKAAWAILISQYQNSDDIVFGSTVMGRQAPLAGVELIAGPVIATVPIRVTMDWQLPLHELLQDIHSTGTQMIPFEQYGLGRLQRLNANCRQACQFQSLLVIQPRDENDRENNFLFLQRNDDDNIGHMYSLVLECVLGGSSSMSSTDAVTLGLSFDDQVIDGPQADRILLQLDHILKQLSKHEHTAERISLSELDLLPEQDRQQIWAWNEVLPETIDSRIDCLIAERVSEQPDSFAINAWDGQLTYRELFDKALQLANWLVVEQGVRPESPIILCCSKSMWTPVIMLAVIIAGGVVVLVDPSQAVERLQSIALQVNARLTLASPTSQGIAEELTSSAVYIVNDLFFHSLQHSSPIDDRSWIPIVSGSNALYVVFTSGSTGTPKGIVITHANACSAVVHQKSYWGYDTTTRIFDLSSYSFDFVWVPFLHGLYAGSCICIPSEDDRRNNIAGSIRELDVNYLNITPSLARLLEPESLPGIKNVALGGEAVKIEDITRWGKKVKVLNAYGPSECTIASTMAVHETDFDRTVNIGKPRGLNAWITSCNHPKKLAPIGAIGELVLEGPLVGRGYLNNPEKKSSAFIENPPWLSPIDGDSVIHSRRRRLYRTGDLASWNSHGRLVFEGRADTQVKIRGQRVELEDIEFHVSRFLGPSSMAVAQVIEASTIEDPEYSSQRLTVFLSSHNLNGDADFTSQGWRYFPKEKRENLNKHLTQVLPLYMIPSTILELKQIPLMPSGKIDRKRLREFAAHIKLEGTEKNGPVEEPRTDFERALREVWSTLLGIPAHEIGRQENFFDLGGDSLMAIRLVGAARQKELPLSVALIFENPQLDQMAAQLSLSLGDKGQHPDLPVTGHLPHLMESLRQVLPGKSQVARLLSAPEDMICDILPVTDFQRYAIRSAFTQPRTEWNYFSMKFRGITDTANLTRVCHQLVSSLEILRCVFLPHDYHGQYIQVVLRTLEIKVTVIHDPGEPLDEACARVCLNDYAEQLIPGAPFVKFFIFQSQKHNMCQLVMGVSHALYDGISLPLIAEHIGALFDGRPVPNVGQFSSYVKFITSATSNSHEGESCVYWRSLLQDAPVPTNITSDNFLLAPGTQMRMYRDVKISLPYKGVTVATAFAAAWGTALARVTGKCDVVFGRAVSGRTLTSATADHETVVGPCLNIVPVRMKLFQFDPASPFTTQDKSQIVKSLQSQFLNSIPHETMGLSEIARQCTDWPQDISTFGSLFYFQNIEQQVSVLAGGQDVAFVALPLERPDPPEPPRLNVLPRGEKLYTLELLVPEQMTNTNAWSQLLDAMVEWFDGVPGDA
ncbi:AMP-dependent synthetase/ligase [Penicillium coprophilum]|uniref:AMP-dependent synthetase/ligase n=1 Tax=Penicillium coprophilum TaxID=36646 RepID=UPI0023986598|nr:AMP-dependent synthetase/ligase [Penicillium coprophilum]KAJ5158042.1 AMP-dependent synthetase/ligase [Penicillium coprophilum]